MDNKIKTLRPDIIELIDNIKELTPVQVKNLTYFIKSLNINKHSYYKMDKYRCCTKDVNKLIEIYNNTSQCYIKNNIFDIMKLKNVKPKYLSIMLNIPYETTKSYTNTANKTAKVTFEIAVKICNVLNINIDELLIENNRIKGKSRGGSKKWTEESIKQFILEYEQIGKVTIAKQLNIKEGTAKYYYSKFKQEN